MLEDSISGIYVPPTPSCYLPRRYVVGFLGFFALFWIYIIRVMLSIAILPISEELGYDAESNGLILSAFYWGYASTQVPGGWLARRFGFKTVMGFGLLFTSLATFILPFVASSLPLLMISRMISGLSQGVMFPSAYQMLAYWFPKKEISTVSSIVINGGAWGTVLAMALSPSIITWLNWQSLCFIAAGCPLLLLTPWLLFVHDTPQGSSSISCLSTHSSEVAEIEGGKETPQDQKEGPQEEGSVTPILVVSSSSDSSSDPPPLPLMQPKIPWLSIIFHPAVMALYAYSFAGGWGWYVFLSWLPTYLKTHLGLDLQESGFISIFPYLLRPIVGLAAGSLIGVLVNRGIVSLKVARKISQALSALLPASVLILLSYTTPPKIISSILVISVIGLGGFCSGVDPNAVDLSPKYASIIFGITNVFGAIPGIVGVYLTGWILRVTDYNWSVVFLLASSLYVAATIIYAILGRAEFIDFDAHEMRRRRKKKAKNETRPLLVQ